MSAHTPGPWLIDGVSTVYASAQVAMPSGRPHETNRFFLHVSRGHGPDGELISKDELAANANLIAAAPDGYAAAKHMLESARGVYGDDIGTYPAQWRDSLRALAAFVAKAEGRS